MMVFWRDGYEGASLASLTKAMRINGPSLYNTFGNKQALFNQALQRYLEQKAVYLPTALRQPTARDAVLALFAGAIDLAMNPAHPSGCMLVHGALATGPACRSIRGILSKRRAGAEAAIKKRFEIAIAAGDLPRDVDPGDLARFIMTIVWGLSVQAAGGATRADLESVASMTMRHWPYLNAPVNGAG